MGVRILTDSGQNMSVLYCSTSGWAFGPVFEHDSEAKAEAFLAWFRSERRAASTPRVTTSWVFGRPDDPRNYAERDLKRFYDVWREEALDEEGNLRIPPPDMAAAADAEVAARVGLLDRLAGQREDSLAERRLK